MKFLLGIPAILIGVGLLIFSLMTWTQLRNAATDPAPNPADYPLLEFMTPDPAPGVPPKPAELAQKIRLRLIAVGGFGLFLAAAGGVACLGTKKDLEAK